MDQLCAGDVQQKISNQATQRNCKKQAGPTERQLAPKSARERKIGSGGVKSVKVMSIAVKLQKPRQRQLRHADEDQAQQRRQPPVRRVIK